MSNEKKERKVEVSLLHSRTDFGYSIFLYNKVQQEEKLPHVQH
jgi:hypothetical protein